MNEHCGCYVNIFEVWQPSKYVKSTSWSVGKESSVSSLKARMAALKKGIGIGSSDAKGTKLALAAAATDAGAIQHRMACIIQV